MSELPLGWIRCSLNDVLLDHQPGFACGKKDVPDGLRHLRMNNIGVNGKLNLELVRTVPPSLAGQRHYLSKGDVLICTTNSGKLVGKCAPFDLEGEFAFSNHLTKLRPNFAVESKYLHYQLWLRWKEGAFEHKCKHWVNQSTLPKAELLSTDILLAPLNEQHRIVAKLEKLLSRVTTAQRRLATIPRILKRFRQSILTAAISGSLTADWREEHFKETFQQRWDLTNPIESSDLPEIPRTWIWRRLGDISQRVSVGHVGPTSRYYCDRSVGIPLIRSQNVRPRKLVLEDVQFITREFHNSLKKSQLRAGDLLIVRVGANRGNVCTVPQGIEDLNCANVIFARPLPNICEYLELYCQSDLAQSLLLGMTTGSAQGVLNTRSVAELPVPIPPLLEQHEMRCRVEALFKTADALEARYLKAKAHVDKLTQSILAKSFRGELVPQDPSDEPACSLLEHISQSRVSNSEKKKKRNRASLT